MVEKYYVYRTSNYEGSSLDKNGEKVLGRIYSQPDIESITKQYLYQLAYREFIDDHKITEVKNCFLIPSIGNEIDNVGHVSMDMLKKFRVKKYRSAPVACKINVYSLFKRDENKIKQFDVIELYNCYINLCLAKG